jgi:four helix bundle protein
MAHEQSKTKERFFPHEGLAAYTLARQAVQFVTARRSKLRGLPGGAGQQLERAVVGAHTNLCSGAAQLGAEAKRQFRIALAETSEAGGATDLALDLGAFTEAEHAELRQLLLRLGAMLRGLAR